MSARRLHLDYVAPRQASRIAGVALLAVALGAATLLVERYQTVRLELARLDAAEGLLDTEGRPSRAVPRERLQEEARNAEDVLRQLALPWSAIIETVEGAASADVAVLQMQPDAQNRQLRLTVIGRSREAMLDYVRTLAAAKAVADPHLVNHLVRADEPGQPVQFTVQAALRGLP